MTTKQVTDRRTELLEAIVDVLLEDGVAELSLRPLAERVGTSARLLIYHFDSKEALIAAALMRVRARVADALRDFSNEDPSPSLGAALVRFWRWATAPPNQRYFRLLFEIDGLGMYGRLRFTSEAQADGASIWLSLIRNAEALSGHGVAAPAGRAMLMWTTLAGLLQDFLSTGDRARTTDALHYFLTLLGEDARV